MKNTHLLAATMGLVGAMYQPSIHITRTPHGPYQCKCGKRFHGRIALKQHIKAKHRRPT